MALPTNTRKAKAATPGSLARGRGTLMDHLHAADSYHRLAEQARRLQRLQTLLDANLPAYLLPGTHIANLKRGTVIIHADSGAVAVKLRQLAPRLTEAFIQQGQEVTGIQVRVQARLRPAGGNRPTTPALLGNRSKQALTSLAAGLEEGSPVRQALQKLLRNG